MRRAAAFILLALAGVSAQAQGGASSQPLKIKVVLQTRTTAFLKTPTGILLPRRSTLEPFMIEDIKAALVEAMAKVEALRKVKPLLYLAEDSEHACGIYEPGSLAMGIGESLLPGGGGIQASGGHQSSSPLGFLHHLVQDSAGILINTDPFDAIDGVYRGPYDASFIIHPGLDGPTMPSSVGASPLWSISWNSPTRLNPKDSLRDGVLARLSTLSPDLASLRFTEFPPVLGVFGEAEETIKEGVATIRSTGVVPRGGYRIAIAGDTDSGAFRFSVRTTSQEPLALVVSDKQGRQIQTIMLKGRIPGLPASYKLLKNKEGQVIQAGPEWTDFSISFKDLWGDEPGASVSLGPPAIPLERGPLEKTAFEFRALAPNDGTDALSLVPGEASEAERDFLAWRDSLAAGWDDAKVAKFTELLASPVAWIRSSAMDAAFEKPEARLIGPLRAVAGSGAIGESFLACRSLGAAGAEGQAALADVLRRGPFETNRRFAAEFLKAPLDRSAMNMVSVLLVNRGWRTRLAAARALAQTPVREAQVALAGTLDFRSEPHPAVRLVIAEACDVAFELSARRLLYAAVNDPSQWVRGAALVRLLDCPNTEIRAEAIKGVSDDSPTVRAKLLAAMTQKPSPEFRVSLRQAVTDRHPKVRAAALRAFAAQQEAVTQGEIENTLKDDSLEVQLALVDLGRSGKFRLPQAVVDSLKASPHEEVRRAVETLPSS